MQDFYREARFSFLKEQRQAVDAERQSGVQQLQAKQEELEMLKDELAVTVNSLREADVVVWKACMLVSKVGERSRERGILQRKFFEWRSETQWNKRERLLGAKADKWYEPCTILLCSNCT
jgi:hypothetical protein